MPTTVLITQCLQRDFVAPVGPDAPVSGPLHVGEAEARRLLGDDPDASPLAAFLQWAHGLAPEQLTIVHLRDWHEPGDSSQAAHLERFGSHCLAGTEGARFVAGIDELAARRPSTFVLDAPTLNDFADTRLADILARARAAAPDGQLRVAVIGVWTDAKVSFLLYDLATRAKVEQLATCSALTASVSVQQHHSALDQLRRLLDVRVLHSPTELGSFLVDGEASLPLPRTRELHGLVDLELDGAAPVMLTHGEPGRALAAWLLRECTSARLRPLRGGFSGACVALVDSVDRFGHVEARSVLKLGSSRDIGSERAAFELVAAVLGNHAPTLMGHADMNGKAALRFRFAAMGDGKARTFQDLVMGGSPQHEIHRAMTNAFQDILGKLYLAGTPEPVDLFDAYGFSAAFAEGVARSVRRLVGTSDGEWLDLPRFGKVANVARLYDTHLQGLGWPRGRRVKVSFVHGDLNGRNIIVDGQSNTWLIDFGRARRLPVFTDFAKLENDLLFIMTPIEDLDAKAARRLVDRLCERELGEDIGPLPELPERLSRVRDSLEVLRTMARGVAGPARPSGYHLALLRYAVHTLSFDEPSELQLEWALYVAGKLTERALCDYCV